MTFLGYLYLSLHILLRCFVLHAHICWVPPAQTLTRIAQPHSELAVTSIVNQFRIKALYTEAFNRIPNSEKIKKEIVEYALNYWSNTLSAKLPLKLPLRASRGCYRNKYELHRENGQIYPYCMEDCDWRPKCFTLDIPRFMLDKCRVMKNGQPVITEDAPGDGLPDTDYGLFVDASNTEECTEGTLAYATTCQIESDLDRPTLGYINFCPSEINTEYPKLYLSRDTALHEMTHAFGFAPMMYAFMRDENGNPRTPRDKKTGLPNLGQFFDGSYIPSSDTLGYITKTWVSAVTSVVQNRTILKTPKLVEIARKYFDCPTLAGVEMEDQGGFGTVAAHFEKRLLQNELMTGSIDFGAILSEFTLAFFVDSGWYNVDMSRAQEFRWAKGTGCDFVQKSCYEYMRIKQAAGKSILPWCNELFSEKTTCLDYLNAYGTCNLQRNYAKLPARYRYFKSLPGVPAEEIAYYGGVDSLADHCPYPMPVLETQNGPNYFCNHVENTVYNDKEINILLQTYGPNSLCFDHDRSTPMVSYQCQERFQYSPPTASCHKFECVSGIGLVVSIGEKHFNCPPEGGSIRVDTVGQTAYITGRLICPKCNTVCGQICSTAPVPLTIPDEKPYKIPCPSIGSHRPVGDVLLFVAIILLNVPS